MAQNQENMCTLNSVSKGKYRVKNGEMGVAEVHVLVLVVVFIHLGNWLVKRNTERPGFFFGTKSNFICTLK